MKLTILLGSSSALCLSATLIMAQETSEMELLKKQLKQTTDNFEKIMQEQRQVIDALTRKVEALQAHQAATNPPQPITTAMEKPVSPTAGVSGVAEQKKWSPADPIRLLGSGQNYVNLSFDGLFSAGGSTADDIENLQTGGHDPVQRGFTVQNLELTLDGKVDPYFRAQANIVYQIDAEGESFLEVEEAYIETMSLPWNLQVKGGQYFTEFGRLNPTHPHSWDFVDQPLVNGRILGPDGLRNPGARVSWLAPTLFYSELYLSVQNSQGETAFSFRNGNEDEPLYGRFVDQGSVESFGDLLFAPRYAASFNLNESQTLVAGLSGAFGPNSSGRSADTQIYGADLFYKWKPVNHSKGFPFVSWQNEAMLRRYEASAFTGDVDRDGAIDTVPGETLQDWGFYSQVAWGFKRGWVAGLRGDYVRANDSDYEEIFGLDPQRNTRWRVSPNLTFHPSEFSKLRLQYNYDDREDMGQDHSVWVQFEFLLGAHSAHRF